MSEVENTKCAVYSSADDNFIVPAIIALDSIRRFHPEEDYFIIGNKNKIASDKLVLLENNHIEFIHSVAHEMFVKTMWSTETYLTLFGPEMFYERGYKYSLYVDGDTLCVSPLGLDDIFSKTIGFAGIENMRPRHENFAEPEFVQNRWGLSDEVMNGHNTNAGVIFCNNQAAREFQLGRKSIEVYEIAKTQNKLMMIAADQSLWALVTVAAIVFPLLFLPYEYNYRVGNKDDMLLDSTNVKIFHYLVPKPWTINRIRNIYGSILKRSKESFCINLWFQFVKEQGQFNYDLSIKKDR